ncbi:MAG: hypothetical protein V1649_00075 [Patescibacteria group bacterium]
MTHNKLVALIDKDNKNIKVAILPALSSLKYQRTIKLKSAWMEEADI